MIYTQAKPHGTGGYFPHIDGLRGLAVISVILFHLGVYGFDGGFVGVDVFFVISGYLITAQIQGKIHLGKFSYSEFYLKRIRRLLPALFFTLCITLIAGYFIFPYSNFERLGHTTFLSMVSLSNFWFWQEAGYFDSDALVKPLLHTWSLSVEEQFYFVWPAILLLAFKFRASSYVVIILGVISLIFAEYFVRNNASFVFYMTPFRIIEFSIGGVLYWIKNNDQALKNHLLGLLGLALLFLSVVFYDEKMLFPGVSALLPCAATALLIYSGGNSLSGFLLSNKPLVFIGSISYSLYLVHWPLIVFVEYSDTSFDELLLAVVILVLAVIIAIFMYFYVEKPFRKKVGDEYFISNNRLISLLLVFVGFISLASFIVVYSDGRIGRLQALQFSGDEIARGKSERFNLYKEMCGGRGWDVCDIPLEDKERNVLVIGDSHSIDGLNAFSQAFPGYHYVLDSQQGCPPIVASDSGILSPKHPERAKCILLNERRFSTEFLSSYRAIVISVYFGWYNASHLSRAIDEIKKHTDAPIFVFGNYIALNTDMPDLFNKKIDPRIDKQYIKSFALYESELLSQAKGRYYFISKKEAFCKDQTVESCALFSGRELYTYDQHHLSEAFSFMLSQRLSKILSESF